MRRRRPGPDRRNDRRATILRGSLVSAVVLVVLMGRQAIGQEGRPDGRIDASTLRRKVLCGYQGWFRCPGDPSGDGWRHWSRDGRQITPRSVTFEIWPDVSELGAGGRYPATGFTLPDGSPATLFSSADEGTVRRHFKWMRDYAIDGVFVQRFLVELGGASTDLVLGHVRTSAAATGRVYAIGYDLSGCPADRIEGRLFEDWERLVDRLKVTRDDRYQRHDGRPVVFVWGLYPDRFAARLAHRIIDRFQEDGPYRATVVGGVPWSWRTEGDAEWARAFRRLDVVSPWNVGNVTVEDGKKQAATRTWAADLAEARRSDRAFLPVIYPGFGWSNLKGPDAAGQTVPRLGGEFFWRQFIAARGLGVEMAYVAMFDEVDEATAVFKVSNSPPREGRFATYEGLPADWYLRLTGEGSRLIRGERTGPDRGLPIRP